MEEKKSLVKKQQTKQKNSNKNKCITTENIYIGFLCHQCINLKIIFTSINIKYAHKTRLA